MEEKHKRSVRGSTFLAFVMHALAWMVLLTSTREAEENSERAVQEAVFNNNEMIIRINAAHKMASRNTEILSRSGGIVRGTAVVSSPSVVDSVESTQVVSPSVTPDK